MTQGETIMDEQGYATALRGLPQEFGEIVRQEGRYQVERDPMNARYWLWHWDDNRWDVVGGADYDRFSKRWYVGIVLPYDPATDTDYEILASESNAEAAVEALWAARYLAVV